MDAVGKVGRPRKIDSPKVNVFSLINEISFTIPKTIEDEETINGEKIISWGGYYPSVHTLNPEFYSEISAKCPTLSAIISRRQDYLMGKGVESELSIEKNKLEELIYRLFKDLQVFGGFAIQIGWNGAEYQLEYIKIGNLRTNKDRSKFYYYEDWKKRDKKTFVVFDAFTGTHNRKPQIIYYKEPNTSHYPEPLYVPALTSCDTQIRIQDFNNNTVANNFNVSGYITIPAKNATDEEINKIEASLAAKFSGNKNAAKFFAITYDPDMNGQRPELQRLTSDTGFAEQYLNIDKNTKDIIYQTMKAIPALFGDVSATTGFNSQEFTESYIQESTYINRLQGIIVSLFESIYGENAIKFIPYMDIEERTLDSELIIGILTNSALSDTQKRALLRISANLEKEEIEEFFKETVNNNEDGVLQSQTA